MSRKKILTVFLCNCDKFRSIVVIFGKCGSTATIPLQPLSTLPNRMLLVYLAKLDGTRWASIDAYASAYCDLDLRPFDLINMSQAQIHTHGEITSSGFKDIVFIQFFGSLPAVTNLLIPKANQHIHEPKYICDQNWVKVLSLVFEIWCSQVFGSLPAVTTIFDLLTSKAYQHIYDPFASMTKIG